MNRTRLVRFLIFGILMFSLSAASFAQIGVGISVRIGPPAIPVYSQPICPGPGYFWTPGYWAWNDVGGYYWVPGTWVVAPVGMLWTPGYWGWGGGFYRWHAGYWGPHVGFYGGINYGFGYTGVGFYGGEWRGGSFFYNRAVMNVNVTRVTNVYERRVVVNNTSRVSFNGGSGGINARPTAEEERFEREPHREALADQLRHERSASENRQLFANQNHGRPAIAATGRPGEFKGRDVVKAREAGEPYRAPKMSPKEARAEGGENRTTERDNRAAERENRTAEQRNENNRNNAERENRDGNRGFGRKTTAKQQVRQEQNDQRRQQHEAKAEQKRQDQAAKSEQRRQQQAQRVERKQAQQAQKKQQKEQKRAPREEHNPER